MASLSISVEIDPALPTPGVSDEAISTWIEARLNDARNLFIQQMSRGGGSGAYYRRGGKRRSAPGEYPVTEAGTADAGRLVNSVQYEMRGPHEGALFSEVQYATYLAEGTRHMAARRMLADALTEVLESRPREDALASAARIRFR